MNITEKKIDRLIKRHKKNGEWGLQLGCIWIVLKEMIGGATFSEQQEMQNQINKIECALGEKEVIQLNRTICLSYGAIR